jgi:putative transposase
MRTIPLVPKNYYHIYNRGVNKERIFFRPQHWDFFLYRLAHYCTQKETELIAYCLMPNHYHLLVYIKTHDFGRNVMHPLGVSYTKAVNQQLGRSGHLFQGSFQAQLVDKDAYLLHLSRYIHLNPVIAGLVESPQDWEYSSYREYISEHRGNFLRPEIILNQFPSSAAYEDFVCESIHTDLQIPETLWIDH